jgi:flagellar hook-basal body complex protein FliE
MIKTTNYQPSIINKTTSGAINDNNNKAGTSQTAAKEFVDIFKDMFTDVNNEQIAADSKIAEMVAGKNKDISGTMIQMEKADISLRMLMAVRNKAVSAYEEVMRMQI